MRHNHHRTIAVAAWFHLCAHTREAKAATVILQGEDLGGMLTRCVRQLAKRVMRCVLQDCANGPEDLQDPPTWLPKSNGPIDDEERADTIPAIKLQRVQSQEESVPSLPKTQATTQQQIIPFTAVGGRRRLQATL